jgi:hypothetical protein
LETANRGGGSVDVKSKIEKAVKRLEIKAFRPKAAFCDTALVLLFYVGGKQSTAQKR